MKAITAIALGLSLAASTAFAQVPINQASDDRTFFCDAQTYASANIPQAKKGFLWSTESDNDGVVETILAHVTHMRIMLPQEEMNDLESAVTRLATDGRTPMIRYKAYLATMVFSNPTIFREAVATNYAGCNVFFCAIAARLQQTMLSSTTQ